MSYWKDIWDNVYGRCGCGSRDCDRGCEPKCTCHPSPAKDCEGKLIVAVKAKDTAPAYFHVVNPTSDIVEIELTVEGFTDGGSAWVTATAENDNKILKPGEARKIIIEVKPTTQKPGPYSGFISVKTPFTKRIELQVQIAA